ncbi:carboxymuconolactone decarboxylase family protein [Campylobacter corcagiensis]|uniref:carboxymuconolactone decarboxylase family protein n=1 Tax=Campylobacter corcagiensis TaxID=1448857 RepID=UPI0022349FE3|nr:carboxymuconolactone decarboxylase family protein [Campylobacter corcagiensis]
MTAKNNGVSKNEMAEIITHLAFYAGWPNAWAAFRVAKDVYSDDENLANPMFGLGEENKAFEKYFTGKSYLKHLAKGVYNATFEPKCRNNWHTHKAKSGGGQILLCVNGEGWYQEENQKAISLTPGEVVTIKPNVKHWHGAKKDSWFSHVAIEVDGKKCENLWLEKVSDEEYDKL